jgi:tRNA(fMet)-specific endonuclease VapC
LITMDRVMLDTDTLSLIMRSHSPKVMRRAAVYLAEHQCFTFSLITRYEILRGLKSKLATVQISEFELRCMLGEVLGLTDEIVVVAADLYAALKIQGQLSETRTS